MMKEKLNISASNIVNVCIDNIDGVERSGRFYCYYSEEPIFFRSIHELFRYMERFMNELNFPQSSQSYGHTKTNSRNQQMKKESLLQRSATVNRSLNREEA